MYSQVLLWALATDSLDFISIMLLFSNILYLLPLLLSCGVILSVSANLCVTFIGQIYLHFSG